MITGVLSVIGALTVITAITLSVLHLSGKVDIAVTIIRDE